MENESKRSKSNPSAKKEATDWVKCKSKSRPGKCYLFNKATGESRWIDEQTESSKDLEEKTAAARSPPVKVQQTLSSKANDRLKRLQATLQKDKPKASGSLVNLSSTKRSNAKISENSKPTKGVSIPPSIKQSTSSERDFQPKRKKLEAPISPRKRLSKFGGEVDGKSAKLKNLPNSKTTAVYVESSDVANKTRVRTKRKASADANETQKQATTKDRHKKEAVTSPKSTKSMVKAFVKDCASNVSLQQPVQEPVKSSDPVPSIKALNGTSRNLITPATEKGSAKKRLDRLRQTLLQNNNNVKEVGPAVMLNNSNDANDTSSTTVQRAVSIPNTANRDSGYEAMDWDPIEELLPNQSATDVSTSFLDEPADMDVDENLFLVAAEKTENNITNTEKWRKDHIYFVLDTNVFVHNLNFVKQLSTKKFTGTNGTVVYIPYVVLQELDSLKLRDNIKSAVVRAIYFLNQRLEALDDSIQAQSAKEERKHHILIECSDDNVLNCCLQVQEYVKEVMLITDDVNLRNKAFSNSIFATSTSNMITKQFDLKSLLGKSATSFNA